MPDRNAILRALHCRAQDLMIDRPACDQCDYRLEMPNGGGCDFRRLCRDAAAVMAEQDAVEPVTESSVYDPDTWFFVCGSCKKGVIDRGDKFCRWCGRGVKWE